MFNNLMLPVIAFAVGSMLAYDMMKNSFNTRPIRSTSLALPGGNTKPIECGWESPEWCTIVETEILEENREPTFYLGDDIILSLQIEVDCEDINRFREKSDQIIRSCRQKQVANLTDFNVSSKDNFTVEYLGNKNNTMRFKLVSEEKGIRTVPLDLYTTFNISCSKLFESGYESNGHCIKHNDRRIYEIISYREILIKNTFTINIVPEPFIRFDHLLSILNSASLPLLLLASTFSITLKVWKRFAR